MCAAFEPSVPYQRGQAVRFRLFSDIPWLRHGITTRDGPGLVGNLSFARGPDAAAVVAARARWGERIGVAATDLVLARQVHGTVVEQIGATHRGRGALVAQTLPDADALTTNATSVPLMAVFADCVPIIVVDPDRRAVAVAHAGWRGTVAGVAGAIIAAMQVWYGSEPAHLLAGIGPSIGPCCYTVGEDVAHAAATTYDDSVIRPGPAADNPVLDLWTANELALRRAGLSATNIEVTGLCTHCRNDLFFSHRTEGPTRGLFGAIVALVPSSGGGW